MTPEEEALNRRLWDAQRLYEDDHEWTSIFISGCQSPIERKMAIALRYIRGHWANKFPDGVFLAPLELSGRDWLALANTDAVIVVPQYQVGPYRADFAVIYGTDSKSIPVAKCLIECDGHDFHEKTKDQARRDKARDRYLALQGWTVLRFTGSEIWADPVACANQVEEFLTNAVHAAYRADKSLEHDGGATNE